MVKLYVTCTSGKNFRMQHCIVSLYRSVSNRDVMPSGRLAIGASMVVREESARRAGVDSVYCTSADAIAYGGVVGLRFRRAVGPVSDA